MNPLYGSEKTEFPVYEQNSSSDYFKFLPPEIVNLILLNTDTITLANSNCVSLKWRNLSNNNFLWNELIVKELILKGYRNRVFASGNFGTLARYPRNLCMELDKPSPYFPNKKVGETSFVVFKDPDISNCKALEVWAEEHGLKASYKIHSKQVSNLEIERSLCTADWFLIPDCGVELVIPKSRKKSLGEQKTAIEVKDKSYRPGTLFEISLVFFIRLCFGQPVLSSNPPVYTRCLSTNENSKPFILSSNDKNELIAMPFFEASKISNTGIIPIKELHYTNEIAGKIEECPQLEENSRQTG